MGAMMPLFRAASSYSVSAGFEFLHFTSDLVKNKRKKRLLSSKAEFPHGCNIDESYNSTATSAWYTLWFFPSELSASITRQWLNFLEWPISNVKTKFEKKLAHLILKCSSRLNQILSLVDVSMIILEKWLVGIFFVPWPIWWK